MKVTCSVGKGEMPHEECLQCALKGENTCGFDYSLLKALFDRPERNGIHVTDLTGCLLRAYWEKIDPSPQPVHELLALSLGTMVHSHLERPDEYMDCEVELEAEGVVGRADVIYKDGRILDQKSTRWMTPSKLPYGSHALQVNLYGYLLKKMGREVKSLAIQYIDMSGPTKCRKCKLPLRMNGHGLECPRCGWTSPEAHLGAMVVEVPLMLEEDLAAFVNNKRSLLAKAIEDLKPPRAEPSYLCGYCANLWRCPEGSAFQN